MKVDLDWLNANSEVQTATTRYVITKYQHEQGIWCRTCGMLSFSQGDVVNKYCGNCHVFHDEEDRRHFPHYAAAHISDGKVSVFLPGADTGQMSRLTVDNEVFLIGHDKPRMMTLFDLNGSELFDIPQHFKIDDAAAACRAYIAGRNRERVRQETERRG